MTRFNKAKVVVALSGGVDSSLAAALLKKQGFEVIGVFMKFWSPPQRSPLIYADSNVDSGYNRCCSPAAEARARKVAEILNIPFYVFNFEKEFKKRVVDYFLKEYQLGRTPNPCVVCNKEIKFGLFLERTRGIGADFVASGHYARLRRETRDPRPTSPADEVAGGRAKPLPAIATLRHWQASEIGNYWYKLLKAKDKEKDQSYFLWMLNQEQLKHILFPIGDYTKKEVRNLARKFGLPVWQTPESQEICFVQKNLNDFLAKYLKQKPGKIVNKKGKVLGGHQGLAFYTIGQRKGIGLSAGPFYVLDKAPKENVLLLTQNKKDLFKRVLLVENINWISGVVPKLPLKIKAKIRYHHQPAWASITGLKNLKAYKLTFEKAQAAITPGQSAVFYKNKEVLGGGIIRSA